MNGYEAFVALAAIQGAVTLYRLRTEHKTAAAKRDAARERKAAS